MAGRGKFANIRYAVAGLGHLAQVAVLPGFNNAPSQVAFRGLNLVCEALADYNGHTC
jgi:hypothetical protein